MPKTFTFCLVIVSVSLTASLRAAEPPGAAEAKLRESLRGTMLQLRDAQAKNASLEAEKADIEAKRTALAAELETMKKTVAENQAESKKAIDERNLKVQERDKEIGGLRVDLDKWKLEYEKITAIATSKETERAKLAQKAITLDRHVADQRTKNASMYALGLEVLSRYERFGLGDALTAREPFVGVTRVKFQNLIQDYSDRLEDAKIKPDAAPKPAPGAPPPGKPASQSDAGPKPGAKPGGGSKPDSKPKPKTPASQS